MRVENSRMHSLKEKKSKRKKHTLKLIMVSQTQRLMVMMIYRTSHSIKTSYKTLSSRSNLHNPQMKLSLIASPPQKRIST